jgi:hypothetical protein
METTTATTAATWRGWYRPGPRKRWRAVVEAASEAEAWARVLAYPLSGDNTASQRDPNAERPRWPVSGTLGRGMMCRCGWRRRRDGRRIGAGPGFRGQRRTRVRHPGGSSSGPAGAEKR